MNWEIILYRTKTGKEVVANFLDSLPVKHKAKAFWEIELLAEKGTSLREPYVKHIDGELWELRIKFSSDISRVFYFVPSKSQIVLLHGFVKKTQKTPKNEIEKAFKNLADYKGSN
jgi:phage-related protein